MNKKPNSTFKFLISYIKPYNKAFSILILLVVIVSCMDIFLPYLLGNIVDTISNSTTDAFSIILISALGYFVINLVSALLSVIYQYYLQVTGSKIVYDIRKETFSHVQSLSLDYFVTTPVGVLVSRLVNDTNKLNDMYSGALANLIKNIFMITGTIIFLFIIHPPLALVTIAVIPLVIIAAWLFKNFSSKGFIKERARMTDINIHLSENLSGMYLTQAFNKEEHIFKEFDTKNKAHYSAFKQLIYTFAIFRPSLYVIRMLGTILIIYFGSKFVLEGSLSIGILISFIMYSNNLFEPIMQISDQVNVIVQSIAASTNIKKILNIEPTVQESTRPIELTDFKGKIEFKNVSFGYTPNELVLDNVSFVINPGETMAFVGATGSGKSTILKLISRYYDVNSGEILVDDINIKDIKISSLRENMGQMLQDVSLFSGTIMENITLFNDDFNTSEVDEVLKYLNAQKFIYALDGGLNHYVREKGSNFSSGQRQLISFARSLIHNPKLLILDEATANIDSESEVIIQDALLKMMNIGTMLIVAHRLSTIQHADNILVLEKGRVVEIGNHQQLLKNRSLYFELYQLQYQKDEQKKL